MLLIWKWMSLFLRSLVYSIFAKIINSYKTNSAKKLHHRYFSESWMLLCSYIVSIVKTTSEKICALIGSMKLLSSEFAFYFYKSTIQSGMETCCHVLAGTSGYCSDWISLRNRCLSILALYLLLFFNPCLIVEM